MMGKFFIHVFSVCLIVAFIAFASAFFAFPVTFAQDSEEAKEVTSYLTEPPELDPKELERMELEEKLAEIEKEISEHQKSIDENKQQQKTLNNEIYTLNKNAEKITLQIKSTDLSLTKLNQEITETQRQINLTENRIDTHKDALGRAIRNLHESDSQSLVEIFLGYATFSDFFQNVNNITLVQYNLRTALEAIQKLRQQLLDQKYELALEKDDAANLKSYQEQQKRNVVSIQQQKSGILKTTKGQEAEYQKLLAKSRETAAQIRSRIFQLLGGGQLTFEKAYEYAKLAESATGVRSAFILAILDQESGIGRNVGKCKYNQIVPQTGKTVMHPNQIPVFLDILKKAGIDPESTAALVSCPILRDGNHGGAMGPAQFMPATWKLYESEIAQHAGTDSPSPWNNAHAFIATALYLKDSMNSSSCRNYSQQIPNQSQMLLERCAAAQYYAGNRWYTYRFAYGDPVVTRANRFQEDIDILNANGTSKAKSPDS